ncbi:unnamed protein product [Rotaria sp. Silwood1]|nr:unnamed protein product [Rotaria sp. Silwood1]CAF4651907.1 unnamed protein product [Rotaria sp. Silwood1]
MGHLLATQTTTTTTAVPVFLLNPGGESGTLSPWSSSSSSSPILDSGTANAGSTPPYNGSYDFYGEFGGSLSQQVSLTSIFSTAQLDSGALYASVSFREKSVNTYPPDTAQVTLIFLSATNSTISNVTTGPIACVSAWCLVQKFPSDAVLVDASDDGSSPMKQMYIGLVDLQGYGNHDSYGSLVRGYVKHHSVDS